MPFHVNICFQFLELHTQLHSQKVDKKIAQIEYHAGQILT